METGVCVICLEEFGSAEEACCPCPREHVPCNTHCHETCMRRVEACPTCRAPFKAPASEPSRSARYRTRPARQETSLSPAAVCLFLFLFVLVCYVSSVQNDAVMFPSDLAFNASTLDCDVLRSAHPEVSSAEWTGVTRQIQYNDDVATIVFRKAIPSNPNGYFEYKGWARADFGGAEENASSFVLRLVRCMGGALVECAGEDVRVLSIR